MSGTAENDGGHGSIAATDVTSERANADTGHIGT
jgi:hypothetical protein